jgi:hypothetical protein
MSKIHVVKSTFRARQYGSQQAIGVKWEVIKDLQEYSFKIVGYTRTFFVNVNKAVMLAKLRPPPKATKGFLASKGKNDILVIPEELWEVKEEKQEQLFKENTNE